MCSNVQKKKTYFIILHFIGLILQLAAQIRTISFIYAFAPLNFIFRGGASLFLFQIIQIHNNLPSCKIDTYCSEIRLDMHIPPLMQVVEL